MYCVCMLGRIGWAELASLLSVFNGCPPPPPSPADCIAVFQCSPPRA